MHKEKSIANTVHVMSQNSIGKNAQESTAVGANCLKLLFSILLRVVVSCVLLTELNEITAFINSR